MITFFPAAPGTELPSIVNKILDYIFNPYT